MYKMSAIIRMSIKELLAKNGMFLANSIILIELYALFFSPKHACRVIIIRTGQKVLVNIARLKSSNV